MAMMLRKDAEEEIIREWRTLPEIERQTVAQAAAFAEKIKDKYLFRYSGSNRYKPVFGMIIDSQVRRGEPLAGP